MPLKSNIISNYLGNGWTTVMSIAFIPLYIKYLGLEAYGLIGVFAMVQALLTLLDVGMTPTLNREMARFTGGAHTPHSIRELLFSIEVVCIVIAGAITIVFYLFSGWLATNWFASNKLPISSVKAAIAIIGFVAALRFVESIYRGAILGLQSHVWLNSIIALMATLRGVGVLGILLWVSSTIEAFFYWQGFVSILTIAFLAIKVHGGLPKSNERVSFSIISLKNVWSFAKGMIATTILSLVITQFDKILLSRYLSLDAFGEYSLAVTVANSLMLLIGPVTQGFYPRFTELYTREDKPALITAYHRGSQLMTVTVIPAALILMFFGDILLSLWTGNESLGRSVAPLVALLALGTAFNGLMNIPYMMQLAYGWSSLAAKVNTVIVLALVPCQFFIIPRFGAIGAAWMWVAINFCYIIIVIPIMHRKVLPGEMLSWYRNDIIIPIASSFSIGFILIKAFPIVENNILSILKIAFYGVAMVSVSVITSTYLRRELLTQLKRVVIRYIN